MEAWTLIDNNNNMCISGMIVLKCTTNHRIMFTIRPGWSYRMSFKQVPHMAGGLINFLLPACCLTWLVNCLPPWKYSPQQNGDHRHVMMIQILPSSQERLSCRIFIEYTNSRKWSAWDLNLDFLQLVYWSSGYCSCACGYDEALRTQFLFSNVSIELRIKCWISYHS
jgi:hypothetical protein